MIRRVLALLVVSSAVLAQDKPSIETLFKLPQFAAMRISPDGENIAALSPVVGHQNLVILGADRKKATPVTTMDDKDIVEFRWLSNKRLLVRTGSLGSRVDDARGGGLYAVDIDGSNGRLLGEGSDEKIGGGERMVFKPIEVVRTFGNSDDFIAQEHVFTADQGHKPGALFRVDSRTGRRTILSVGKPEAAESEGWVVDAKGTPRVFVATEKGMARIYYRKNADAPWVKLDEYSITGGNHWVPLALAEDDKTIYAGSWRGRDKGAVMRYDPETKAFGDVVAAHPQVDLTDLVFEGGQVYGVHYEDDRGGTAWFDETLATVQAAVDKAFPASVNYLSASRDRSRFVITTISDISPGSFYFFDRKAGKLEWMADRMPWIDPKKMSPSTPVRYKARDGLEIPAYITVPKGSSGKNLPMVVMIHGGPWVEGDLWYWDPETQFLASRGYAVLRPNYRGTTRYGWKHFSSSFKQWGLTMQDDISDGVKWAIDEGIADPKRVCIYGASYGGYATMMGLAKTPELFKCGINYVGVTDLDLFVTATWSDFAYSPFLNYELKEMFGDISKDRERLMKTSPVELASRIKAPVLMAYGASDVRVVPEHGSRMLSALEKAGAKPEYMVAEGEGHGFRDMKNQVMFYGAMERFLEKYIGKN
jgi:dipeptidyl aminopeptidase/acylaminoacyl peptidase